MTVKLMIAAVVLVSAVGYLGFAGIRSGWVYYVEVDDFLANPTYHEQRVRLCGRADEQVFDIQPARMTASFDLRGVSQVIPVVYQGVVPNTFEPGIEVVLEGRLDDQGVFQADVMMTKCASKYQAEEHGKRLEAGQ
jgi:cytochrome c-type biogenesis protein CcmE